MQVFNKFYIALTASIEHDLKATEERAKHFVGSQLTELQEAVKAGNFEKVQLWMEENFCSKSKKEHVLMYVSNPCRAYKNMPVREVFDKEFAAESNGFKEEEEPLVWDIIAELSLHRRVSAETMLGVYFKRVNGNKAYLEDLLKRMISAGFIQWDENRRVFITQPWFALSREAQSELSCLQSNIPMVCTPKKVYKPKNPEALVRNGYLKEYCSVFTKKLDNSERHQDVAYDFLNAQNRNAYQINYTYYDVYGKWNVLFPDQDNHTDQEYQKICQLAYWHHLKVHFLISLYRLLGIKYIFFVNTFDYRHRNYPVAYTLKIQGTDKDKANCIFKPQVLTKEGKLHFQVAIANDYNIKVDGKDLDKHTFQERLKFVHDNFLPLLSLPWDKYVEKVKELAQDADSPHCFVAKMLDLWKQRMDTLCGLPATSGIPVPYDATCSGYQLCACLARDEDLAELTNVIMPKKEVRNDLYTLLAQRCANYGLSSEHDRNFLKKKVWIPIAYGSVKCVEENFSENEGAIVNKVISELNGVVTIHNLINEWDPAQLSYEFWLPDAVRVFKKVFDTKDWCYNFMDGQTIFHEKVNVPLEYSCEYAPNVVHSVDGFVAREIGRAMHYDPKWKEWLHNLYSDPSKWTYEEDEHGSRALMEHLLHLGENFQFYSLRILHEANEHNIDLIPEEIFVYLFKSLAEKPCEVMEIHDSFGTQANYSMALMFQYRRILRDIWKSRMLAAIKDYLVHNPEGFTKVPVVDERVLNLIMSSVYALC